MLLDRDDSERWWRSWVDDVVDADENLRREIDAFWANAPRAAKVGSRHHTVPRFYLKRFASKGKLLVRDRTSGEMTRRNIDDLAIRNFYTFVNKDGEEDGRLEDILADLEGGTNDLLNRVFGPFQPVRRLHPGESMALALYLSFQVVRTPRHRREMELMADHSMKLVNQDKLANPTEWGSGAAPEPPHRIHGERGIQAGRDAVWTPGDAGDPGPTATHHG